MAFPAEARDIEVCVAYGANLASDLTTLTYSPNLALTHVKPQVTITRGRIAGASRTQPTTIDFGLKNPNGVFSPRNIVGPHYGQLRRNTPVRVRVDPGTGMVTRAIAYMPDWPTRWTGPDIDDRIPMQASGALRRLGTGQEVKSALKRSILATSPKVYWPLEDASGSTQGAYAVGGWPMRVARGTVSFGSVNDLVGSATAPDISVAHLAGRVTGVSSTAWHCQFAVKSGLFAGPGSAVGFLRIRTDSSFINVWHFFLPYFADARVQVFIDDDAAAGPLVGLNYTPPGTWQDRWHHIGISAVQSGGNVIFKLYVDGVLGLTNSTAATLGAPTFIELNHNMEFNATALTSIAHVEFGDGPLVLPGFYEAATGYSGELAATRVARLCTEETVAYDVTAGVTEAMGPQLPGAISDLLRECEDSDEATLVERRTGVLGFDPRVTRYNKSVVMTLNYATQVADLLPDDDDRDLKNYVTVNRIGGSSGTAQRTTGPLGTDKATGVDRYPDQVSRSLATDAQAVHHAGQLTNIGTVDEPRYVVDINLRDRPELVTQWLACDIGSRIQITSPPAIQTGPAPLDLIIEGYQELIDGVEWYVTLYALPYRPYEVYQIETGTGNRSRIAAGVSTTDLAYSAPATSLSVTSASVRWIDSATYPSKFPILVQIAGEVMTCTAIVGTGLTQTFTVTRGLHGVTKALPITSQVQIWRAPCIAL